MDDEGKTPKAGIPRAWKKRIDELAQLMRDCKHDGRVLENDQGQTFCERCGLRLDR